MTSSSEIVGALLMFVIVALMLFLLGPFFGCAVAPDIEHPEKPQAERAQIILNSPGE